MTQIDAPAAKDKIKKELHEAADELQRIADEIRVKLHLASLDVKSNWEKLEPRVLDFKSRFERVADDGVEHLRALAVELKERLKELKKNVTS